MTNGRTLFAEVALFVAVVVMFTLSGCVGLTGTGTQAKSSSNGTPPSMLSASATSLSFGNVVTGSKSSQTLTLTNTGSATVMISQATVNGAGFSVAGGMSSVSIAAGQEQAFQIQFAPQAAGSSNGSLIVASDASNSTLSLSLSGTGIAGLSITTQPSNQSVTAGQTATFGVAAIGSGTLTYQWKRNGTAISGATASAYTTPATKVSDSGAQFTVTVTNGSGNVTSNPASLTVNAPPGPAPLQIVTNSLPVGTVQSSFTTTLAASGGVPPYSWHMISGQLPAGLRLNLSTGAIAGTPTSAGSFSFVINVQDTASSSVSTGFSLNVSTEPAPTVVGVAPNSGSIDGKTIVTISGSNFRSGATVRFGSSVATSVQVIDSTHIQAVTPVESSGSVNVIVQDSDGQIATRASAFTFIALSNTSWNPASLGVPWASDFISIAANEINVETDLRLSVKAKGDGVTDDTSAIRAAIQLASSSGGGMVYLPTGDYKIVTPSNSVQGSPLIVPSRVILRGSSPSASRIHVNDPNATLETDSIETWGGIDFQGSVLSGMTDLGLYAVNPSTSPSALLWNRGSTKVSELFFNNLDVHLANSKSFWFEETDNLLVQNSQFDSNSLQDGPIYIVGNSHVSFLNNKVTYHFGRVHMQDNANLLMQGNTLIRDAQNKDMDNGTAIESGGVELSFGQNVQALNNTIQTLNAPSDEIGDGEAIMTQQSVVQDVLDAGSATAITSTTLTDTNALWGPVTVSRLAQYPEVVAILTGSATGEWRTIQGVDTSTKTITLNQAWSPIPEVGSLFSIFPWTLMDATIQGNTLVDNPNGIVIYDGCYNCTVQNNVLTNSRGIMLRTVDKAPIHALYPEDRRVHMVAINGKIVNNTVSNISGIRPAYIVADAEAFSPDRYRGLGMINIQVGGNTINPFSANPNQNYIPSLNEVPQEGFFPCLLIGPAAAKDPETTVFQDVHFWNNVQSVPVIYGLTFLPYTSQSCVIPSAPPA
jgi:parallel beta-helix repeat protein